MTESVRSALRVIADVHGEPEALSAAVQGADDRHILLLGDLVDSGPDSAAVLEIVLNLVESGRATLIQSNHDGRLYRYLIGRPVALKPELVRTIASIDAHPESLDLRQRFIATYASAPMWLRRARTVFAHGAFHPMMLDYSSLEEVQGSKLRKHISWLALHGESHEAPEPDALPLRTYTWVDTVPEGITVVVGHDIRSTTEPLCVSGAAGGNVVFLDTGCGKGGRLSWLDLDPV